jgi:maltose-binding protein MalE
MHKKFLMLLFISVSLLITANNCTNSTKTEEKKNDVYSKKVLARVDGDPVFEGNVIRRIRAAHGNVDKTTVDQNVW